MCVFVCVCISGGFLLRLPVFLPCFWLLLRPRGGKERSKFRHLRQVRRRRSVHQLPGMKCTSSPNWFLRVCVCDCRGGVGTKKWGQNPCCLCLSLWSSLWSIAYCTIYCSLCKWVCEAKTNPSFSMTLFSLPITRNKCCIISFLVKYFLECDTVKETQMLWTVKYRQ